MSLIRKNIFACLFSFYDIISLSRHEQVCLTHIIPTLSFFIKIWDLLSFQVLRTTSVSKIRKKKFLPSKDQISKCQFKLTLGIARWVFLFYCKICQIFYYSPCRNKKSLYKNMNFSNNFSLNYNLSCMKILKTIWMKTNIALFTKIFARF